mmetsp:Transcript_27383/g.69083  ORF Transcript_27383/g.69083 Transcript_27383/m.69083 type:complete len:201 (-) Transcript_27383:110-712(-)
MAGSRSLSIATMVGTTALISALFIEMLVPANRNSSSIVMRIECSPGLLSGSSKSFFAPPSQSAALFLLLWHGETATLVTSPPGNISVEKEEKLAPDLSLTRSSITLFFPLIFCASEYSYSSKVTSSALSASLTDLRPSSLTSSSTLFAGSRPYLSRTSHASPSGANTEMGVPSALFSFCRAPARREAMSLSVYPVLSGSR